MEFTQNIYITNLESRQGGIEMRDFTFESFRYGHCERFTIQAKDITEAIGILENDYELVFDINCYLVI